MFTLVKASLDVVSGLYLNEAKPTGSCPPKGKSHCANPPTNIWEADDKQKKKKHLNCCKLHSSGKHKITKPVN